MRNLLLSLLLLFLLGLGGCASQQGVGAFDAKDHSATTASLDSDDDFLDEVYDTQLVPDPLEGWNRAMFVFNDGVITYVARPVNTAYTTVTPQFFRDGMGNFFTNLLFPVRFINNLLQGKGYAAGQEFGKFIINTTAGLGGFINYTGLNHPELASLDSEDFGQTLGVWGVGEGMYLYWPLLGPSSARDTVGKVGDWAADPVTWVNPWWAPYAIKGLRTVNELEEILDVYEDVTKSAIEPYTAVRDAYIQYRRAKVAK
ncbi:VacJ family lipoprotein [Desulfovibrio sp. OttesenSCG-928-O18]|nr:VacJ family lipoprotein [Desulfovibrio sp. OttesenSCG-928-O18]